MASPRRSRDTREERERLRRYEARQSVHEHKTSRRRRDNIVSLLAVLLVAALATGAQLFYFNGGPGTPSPAPSLTPDPVAGENVGDVPDPSEAENRTWQGTIALNEVELSVELDGAAAPQAVAAFAQGVEQDYFTDTYCHRLAHDTGVGLIQCGATDLQGGSPDDYSFGPIENAPASQVYPAGTIAMARVGGDAYSHSRQFFITFEDTFLPEDSAGGYTVFGRVTDGLDELREQIVDGGVEGGATDGPPAVETRITRITIE